MAGRKCSGWQLTIMSLSVCTLLCVFVYSGPNEHDTHNQLKELMQEVNQNTATLQRLNGIEEHLKAIAREAEKPDRVAENPDKVAEKPDRVAKKKSGAPYTVAALAETKDICKTVFPSVAIPKPFGCQENPPIIPQISCKCYKQLSITCDDSLDIARDKYYRHIMRDHCTCSESRYFGRKGDGGWALCMAGPFKPKLNNCLIYSVGIRDDWSFDHAISKQYGCSVMAFDPSIGKDDHKHSEKVWFYNTGLGGKDEEANEKGWKMRTLASLIKQLGHSNKTIDMIKFDIEFSEWTALAAMLKAGVLSQVKQISFEIHTWRDTVPDYIYFWQQLQGLENAGFQRWHHQLLNWRCFKPEGQKRYCPQGNMNFINTNFMKR